MESAGRAPAQEYRNQSADNTENGHLVSLLWNRAMRPRCGLTKPETFKFLGFVLVCGKSRRGDFQIRRKSRRDRMRTKLREIKEALRQRRHRPIPETGKWLAQIVAGYFAYHAVPTNRAAIAAFHYHVVILWHRQLCRRSQKARLVWRQMAK
jgi:hypothetical protein